MARQRGKEVNLLWSESFSSLSAYVWLNHDQVAVRALGNTWALWADLTWKPSLQWQKQGGGPFL